MKKILILFIFTMSSCSYIQESKEVAWEETRPKMLLKKYEYFKNLSSSLDEQRANLLIYQEELKLNLSENYMQQRKSEMIGVAMNYNHLAATYTRVSDRPLTIKKVSFTLQ